MKQSVLALATFLLPAAVMAQNAFVGTWKLDISHQMQLPEKP